MTHMVAQASSVVLNWLASINADGVSAFATLLAIGVALWLPGKTAKKEWARQDRMLAAAHKREDEFRMMQVQQARDDRRYVIHQGCSTVDQIIAYWHASVAISGSQPPFHEGFASIDRFRENVMTLKEILLLLRNKPEISDGLLFTMVNAERIANGILVHTSPPQNGAGYNWQRWVHELNTHSALVEMTQKRNNDVRLAFGLAPSNTAQAITTKYTELAKAIKKALAAQQPLDMTAVPQNHY